MSHYGKRSLMHVEPAKLVELAESSETILATMRQDWAAAREDLVSACSTLGDATGSMNVSSSYADAMTDAADVVAALTETLGLGVAGLLDAAQDAVRADDTVANELAQTGRYLSDDGSGRTSGRWGRRG